jgi:mannose-6-phosphate isomerase-like protein (cupin superfamily)
MWIDPKILRKAGIPVMEVDVKEGQGVWVPYNIPHMVVNTITLTTAFAFNILMPQTLSESYKRMGTNRLYGIDSKVNDA